MAAAMAAGHSRAAANYRVDLAALGAAAAVFSTGLVLLLRFHMGDGSLRGSSLGLSRLVWVNLHRVSGCLAFAALAAHAQLHWRTIWARLHHGAKADRALYIGFGAVSLSAAVAWFIAAGSPPWSGPITPAHLAPARHLAIDLHNFSGLTLLVASVLHVRRHLAWLAAGGRPRAREAGHESQQCNVRNPRPHVVERGCRV